MGLDYHYNLSPPQVQRRILVRQLRLAISLKKNLVSTSPLKIQLTKSTRVKQTLIFLKSSRPTYPAKHTSTSTVSPTPPPSPPLSSPTSPTSSSESPA